MGEAKRRQLKYPDLYGTSACPGANLAQTTSRGRGGTILRGKIGPSQITKREERNDALRFKQGRDMVRDRFVRLTPANGERLISRYERHVRQPRHIREAEAVR